MVRSRRRARQELPGERAMVILKKDSSGMLASPGDEFRPYALPMSKIQSNDRILFHSAKPSISIDVGVNATKVSC